MRINKYTIAILITCGISFSTIADVRIISEDLAVNKTNNANQIATFSQIGFSGEKYPIFKGFGSEMPLEIALKAIVPKTFNINNNNPELLVSFKGGTTWPYVLEQISKKHRLAISIDYNKMIVDVYSDKLSSSQVVIPETKLVSTIDRKQVDNIAVQKEKQIKAKSSIEQKILDKQKEDQRLAGIVPSVITKEHINTQNNIKTEQKYKEVIQPSKNVTITVTSPQEQSLTGGYTQEEFSKLSPQEKTNVILGLSAKNEQKLQEIVSKKEKQTIMVNTNTTSEKLPSISDKKEEVFIQPVQPLINAVDLAKIKDEYNTKFVLPIDPSFDFYVQGGKEEVIDYKTPATYLAKSKLSLEDNLNSWAKEIGWTLEWKTSVRYPIKYPMTMKGTFKETSLELINLFKNSKRPLNISYYPKSKVVEVTDLNHKIK